MVKFIFRIRDGVHVEIDEPSLAKAKEKYDVILQDSESVEIDVPQQKHQKSVALKGMYNQLLKLKEEDFFSEPRSVAEIREKLKEYAVHYPPTAFPPYLQRIVQERVLRRYKQKKDEKEVWVYVNA